MVSLRLVGKQDVCYAIGMCQQMEVQNNIKSKSWCALKSSGLQTYCTGSKKMLQVDMKIKSKKICFKELCSTNCKHREPTNPSVVKAAIVSNMQLTPSC